ncbi:hypothetical protein JVU11DRAFT_2213 [Chiua virens]|nr:hypothetical protein JVU11DRAFT_2213 [Chiua virens]
MPPRPGTRRAQPATSGLGHHFSSAKRPRDKRQTSRLVSIPGQLARHQKSLARLAELLNPSSHVVSPQPIPTSPFQNSVDNLNGEILDDSPMDVEVDGPLFMIEDDPFETVVEHAPQPPPSIPLKRPRRNYAAAMQHQYANWKALLPTLVELYLRCTARTLGKPLGTILDRISLCRTTDCELKHTKILCLMFDHFTFVDVGSCKCSSLSEVLLDFGLFPSAPSQPRMAISMDLLALYRALFERSCDAINALASALHTHYTRRGFNFVNAEGQPVIDPFRRSLGAAVQWFDILIVEVEKRIDNIIQSSRDTIRCSTLPPANLASTSSALNPPSSCAQILVQRCPACFGSTKFGKSLGDGGDIHVATDRNFHHRHRRSAGDSPSFYDPSYFLPKTFVDAIGDRIKKQRKKPARQAHRSPVLDEAIDECEESYIAADGNKQKTAADIYDDTGIMGLICRHDIPLFFANIDSPGEQQKYAIALISHLFSLLPETATVVVFYDIGCVLARTLSKHDILDDNITERLRFATSTIHAYGHQWTCQLVYNPRLVTGLGLSDGKGTERLWSRFIKLIGVERSSSRKCRIWLIDRHTAAVGHEMQVDLGDWIKRRLKCGVQEQGGAAEEQVNQSGYSIEELRRQWALQKDSQLSVRAHAPQRLKKQLDTVISLQSDLDSTERALQKARSVIEHDSEGNADEALTALEGLERTHERLMGKVDGLYASLNVHDRFPALEGVDFEFIHILILARDLKINICKRAIALFFEWDKLDQAVGGGQKPLGTKLHQQTRQAIAKRQPALLSAIRKFNSYCEQLEKLYDRRWAILLPQSLPTKLTELREDQSLLEDVWITPSTGQVPLWLEDSDIRLGIRGLLKMDRCLEEQRWLGSEADNLCRWYGDELAAVELSLRTTDNNLLVRLIKLRRDHLLALESCWITPLASAPRFKTCRKEALSLATCLSGGTPEISFSWITVEVPVPAAQDEDTEFPDPPSDSLDNSDATNPTLADYVSNDWMTSDQVPEEHDGGPAKTPCTRIVWEYPSNMSVDMTPLPSSEPTDVPEVLAGRTCPPQDGFSGTFFQVRDIKILQSPTECLNDICINGCIPLLFSSIKPSNAHQFAIFSTHDLIRIWYNASDDCLWRVMKHNSFWCKDIWIILIHRSDAGGHWVLCVAHLRRKELLLFDSLGERRRWRANVQDVMKLLARLQHIAHWHDHAMHADVSAEWIAHPLVVKTLQTNGYDCGVWVLATVAATIRGFDVTSLSEKDLPLFCHYLYMNVLSSPTS